MAWIYSAHTPDIDDVAFEQRNIIRFKLATNVLSIHFGTSLQKDTLLLLNRLRHAVDEAIEYNLALKEEE